MRSSARDGDQFIVVEEKTSLNRPIHIFTEVLIQCWYGLSGVILFIFLINLNIWIYYTITFCRFTFCFYIHMAKQTNRRKWSVFNETHLQKLFFHLTCIFLFFSFLVSGRRIYISAASLVFWSLCMYYCYNSCNLFNKHCLH
jgi:hypothetical protein